MTRPFFLALVLLAFSIQTSAQKIDSIACAKVEDTLNIIKRVTEDINSDPSLRCIAAIEFLDRISKVPYQGLVSWIGPEAPSKKYYDNCLKWYLENKFKLRWHASDSTIYVIGK